MMELSVVTTVYNDGEEIVALLNDLLAQSTQPSEIVIADGGSSDNTCVLINRFQERHGLNIKLIKGKRLNIAEGFNEAIKQSSSELVAIVATGNHYPSDYFEKLLEALDNKDVYGAFMPVQASDINEFSVAYGKAFLRRGLRIPSNHGILLRRDIFDQYGYFYEKFVYAGEDGEFFLRIPKERLICIDAGYVKWDVPDNYNLLKKQVKVYTIAQMQISGFKGTFFKFITWRIIFQYLLLIILPVSFYYFDTFLLKFLIIGIMLLVYYLTFRNGLLSAIIKITQEIYKLLFIIKENKYLKEEYRVRRN